MSVSVLGLGPMGQALTRALLNANHRTTVWNRTAAKADDVVARGAVWADDPASAIAASDLTLVNVVDQQAVDAVLTAAGDAVAGRVIIGLSAGTPEAVRRTASFVTGAGGAYLDGAIMTPTDTIGTASASVLFSGPRALFDDHREVLSALGTLTWLGEDVGRAEAFDVALLDLFWTSVSGFVHALSIAKANGVTAVELLPHANGISEILPAIFTEIAERVEAGRHDDASAPVSSVAASLRNLISAARSAGIDAGALETFRDYVDAAVAAGHGDAEISRITPLGIG